MKRKLGDQRRQLKNSKAREERLRKKFEEQLVEIEESDHQDLKTIIQDNTCNKNLPEDMLTFWELQRRIIQTSSKKGYR